MLKVRLVARLLRAATVLLAAAPCPSAIAQSDFTWGVNGHPLVSYPGVSFEAQLDYVSELGMTSYRVDIGSIDKVDALAHLVRDARARGITILPVITQPLDLNKETPEALQKKAYDFAYALASNFREEIPVWELGNELENYAIILPCEMQDDDKQYNCSWGPAGGISALEYFGPRWAKVSAAIKGWTEGVRAADPNVRRAIGTAGWGHVGAFERMKADGIDWEISVWHMYGEDPEWAFKKLAEYERPIWVTEFNNALGSQQGEEQQVAGLTKAMSRLRELQAAYHVEAAYIYELMDEAYWGESFEAHMGLVAMKKNEQALWMAGERKPVFNAVKKRIRGGASGSLGVNICRQCESPVRLLGGEPTLFNKLVAAARASERELTGSERECCSR